jgi:putative flippase GtrA
VSATSLRFRELRGFALVGVAAAAVHFAVVAVLTPLGLPPLVANVFAFLCAFGVSFAGHSRWSFPSERRDSAVALRRFFAVAVTSFALNETLYWALLRFTPLDYRVALAFVLVAVAFATLLSSKYWAFAESS